MFRPSQPTEKMSVFGLKVLSFDQFDRRKKHFDCVRPKRAMFWPNRLKLALFRPTRPNEKSFDCVRPKRAMFRPNRLKLAMFRPTRPKETTFFLTDWTQTGYVLTKCFQDSVWKICICKKKFCMYMCKTKKNLPWCFSPMVRWNKLNFSVLTCLN